MKISYQRLTFLQKSFSSRVASCKESAERKACLPARWLAFIWTVLLLENWFKIKISEGNLGCVASCKESAERKACLPARWLAFIWTVLLLENWFKIKISEGNLGWHKP